MGFPDLSRFPSPLGVGERTDNPGELSFSPSLPKSEVDNIPEIEVTPETVEPGEVLILIELAGELPRSYPSARELAVAVYRAMLSLIAQRHIEAVSELRQDLGALPPSFTPNASCAPRLRFRLQTSDEEAQLHKHSQYLLEMVWEFFVLHRTRRSSSQSFLVARGNF